MGVFVGSDTASVPLICSTAQAYVDFESAEEETRAAATLDRQGGICEVRDRFDTSRLYCAGVRGV